MSPFEHIAFVYSNDDHEEYRDTFWKGFVQFREIIEMANMLEYTPKGGTYYERIRDCYPYVLKNRNPYLYSVQQKAKELNVFDNFQGNIKLV